MCSSALIAGLIDGYLETDNEALECMTIEQHWTAADIALVKQELARVSNAFKEGLGAALETLQ